MNATLVALVGLTLGQPPAPDYDAINTRNFKLPIEYKHDRKSIRTVLLYVSRDQGQTWEQEAEQPPTQDAFTYTAKADGVYWFNMVIVDLKGRRDPPNLLAEPAALKMIVDTTPPQVRFTNAKRNGEEVVVEWAVDDRFPDDAATRVYFRAATAPDTYWQEVTLPPGARNGVKFPAGTSGPLVVKVVAQDQAKNRNEGVREIPGTGSAPAPSAQTSTSLSPGGAALPPPPAPPPATPHAAAPVAPPAAPALPPPDLTPVAPSPQVGVASPAGPPMSPVTPAAPSGPVTPPPTTPLAAAPVAPTPPAPSGPTPTATFQGPAAPPPGTPPAPVAGSPTDPRQPVVPAIPTGTPTGGPTAVAVWSGSGPSTGSPPSVELSRVQVTNQLRFDLGYQVEQQGPSGISRVDLWVTRDDGQTWVKWSQHDGREPSVKVLLDHPSNTQPEGHYGFRLVPVSGAGLSEREPARGDAPDIRVVVDTTPPVIEWYDPVSDRGSRDTLVIRWKATDKNFGDDPITLEWAEKPTGPWHPVAAAGENAVIQANAGPGVARKLANTGSHAWRVPPGLPPRVYIKVTARDAAGNVTEGVTPHPVLIDLATPKAKIHGIVPAARP